MNAVYIYFFVLFLIWDAYTNRPVSAEWQLVCRAWYWLNTLQLQSFAKVNLLSFSGTLGELQKSNTSFKTDISGQPKLGHTIWGRKKRQKELDKFELLLQFVLQQSCQRLNVPSEIYMYIYNVLFALYHLIVSKTEKHHEWIW